MKRFFVTGTDTGVGKTYVSALLARQAVTRGERVFAFKPIETGCVRHGSELIGEDQEILAHAAGNWQQGELRGAYRFELAAAPSVAAPRGRIELDRILDLVGQGSVGADLVIVEGAGGWRVPITATEDMASLARRLGFPVIVVARATLGTINHSLLTIESILREGLDVAAVVLSRRPGEDPSFAESNRHEIAERARVAVRVVDEGDEIRL